MISRVATGLFSVFAVVLSVSAWPDAVVGVPYSATIAGCAVDPDPGDTLTFSKVDGPRWLSVAANGALSGTPPGTRVGWNAFTVRVKDDFATSAQATLKIRVLGKHAPTFTAAYLIPSRADELTTLSVVCVGWHDPDGDPEGYLYQWKKNGWEIASATTSQLAPDLFAKNDSISCVVTAWDGVNKGSIIETSPVRVSPNPASPSSTVADWQTY